MWLPGSHEEHVGSSVGEIVLVLSSLQRLGNIFKGWYFTQHGFSPRRTGMLVGPDDRRGGSQVRRVEAAQTTRVVSFGCAFKGRRARKNLVTGCQKEGIRFQ